MTRSAPLLAPALLLVAVGVVRGQEVARVPVAGGSVVVERSPGGVVRVIVPSPHGRVVVDVLADGSEPEPAPNPGPAPTPTPNPTPNPAPEPTNAVERAARAYARSVPEAFREARDQIRAGTLTTTQDVIALVTGARKEAGTVLANELKLATDPLVDPPTGRITDPDAYAALLGRLAAVAGAP